MRDDAAGELPRGGAGPKGMEGRLQRLTPPEWATLIVLVPLLLVTLPVWGPVLGYVWAEEKWSARKAHRSLKRLPDEFRRLFESRRRRIAWDELVPRLRAGTGTLLVIESVITRGPAMVFLRTHEDAALDNEPTSPEPHYAALLWTEDSVATLSPTEIPPINEGADVGDPSVTALMIVPWLHNRYLATPDGGAYFVTPPPKLLSNPDASRQLKRAFPDVEVVLWFRPLT